MNNLTAKQIIDLNIMNQVTKDTELGNRLDIMTTKTGTPVNAANATETLLVSGVVIHGERVIIDNPAAEGMDTYEFLADATQLSMETGGIPVDIEAHATKASVTLTVDTQPTAGDTMTIGTKKFTFVAVGADTEDGLISVGTDLATAKVNIVGAINGAGVHTEHPLVTAAAFATHDCVITAKVGGTLGNAIAATETFTAVSNVFDTATLVSGANCTAANAITALVAAVTASDTQGVGAVDGAGDTVVFTADVAGVAGNSISVVEDMANGSFTGGSMVMSGGIDGTVGKMGEAKIDATYLYQCLADNAISGKNWRRIALGAAY